MSNRPSTAPARHWPRGCSRVIRDLRNGYTIPDVIRRHGVSFRIAITLARRVHWKRLRQDEAGGIAVIMALAAAAWVPIIGLAAYVPFSYAEKAQLQGCVDNAAIAEAAAPGAGSRYAKVICPAATTVIDPGPPVIVTATGGTFMRVGVTATAKANPIALVR